ncbi:MAG: PepSY-associated TM helix domain-containing protein [Gemmatimonadaceae bacterium]
MRRGAGAAERVRTARVRVWTRKLHNYLGLSLLLFLWLFAVSGLVLNHSMWSVAKFWTARREATTERVIRAPTVTGDVAIAAELMRQLGIVGEVGETRRVPDGGRFDFQVVRPGRVVRVDARLDSARARVTEIRLNAWGVLDALHKFTGVVMDEPVRTRDWVLTRIWSLAMDALAVGMVVLVLSGLYLWYRLAEKRRPGLVALALGVACCAFFLYGLGVLLA